MKRTNVFTLAPTDQQEKTLFKIALDCAKLWNEVNYQRRQAYFNYQPVEWYSKGLYRKYAPYVGSATAQQIIRKNNEAWRSFHALKKLQKNGDLPEHIKSVKPPRYWKDRNGNYKLVIILRNDSIKLEDGKLNLPKGLAIRFKGKLKWFGKQCRTEIVYDSLSQKWRVFQTVETQSSSKPKGSKTCHIDLGVVNLATIWMHGWRQPVAFSGRQLLSDWWYWTGKIAKHQSKLKQVNSKHSSKRLRRLYRMRKKRFRHAVNTMTRTIVKDLYDLGVAKIIMGNLKHIRDNNHNSAKANSMIHNFWSFTYMVQRFKDVAEEYGIEIKEVDEYKTSTRCFLCNSENTVNTGRLFKCLSCGLEAHRDAVGVLNISSRQGESINRVMAYPLLLGWNGVKWNRKSGMNNQPNEHVRSENLPTSVEESVRVTYLKSMFKSTHPRSYGSVNVRAQF